jgi:hypothetical protein
VASSRLFKQQVFHPAQEFGLNVVVDLQHPGVDDPHVHPSLDGVIKEDRVDSLPDSVIPPETEGDIADPPEIPTWGMVRRMISGGFDEVEGIVLVFGNAGSYGKNVGVKNDVFRGEVSVLRYQEFVRPLADFNFALFGVRLAGFVEGHDDHRRAVALDELGLAEEVFFPFFEADGVHHRLSLDAFEPSLDYLPLGESIITGIRLMSGSEATRGSGRRSFLWQNPASLHPC